MVEIYMDTGWYVPQPFADLLPLDQPDAEIRRLTDERARAQPGSMPQQEWSERVTRMIAEANGAE